MFKFVLEFIFTDPAAQRVVVEPDSRNEKIHAINKRAGFVHQKEIKLSNKTAYLGICTRSDYLAAMVKESPLPGQAVAHVRPEVWAKVNALHLRKAIAEFAHELLIDPKLQRQEGGWGYYVLQADQQDIEYRFRAQIRSLEHWHIDGDSLEKRVDGGKATLDSLSFIVEIHKLLGINPAMLPTYLEEITSTLYSSAYKHGYNTMPAAELAMADFQTLETSMAEGHPAFVANNGRIGFDAIDYRAYAPEAASPVRLIWLAAHKSKAEFACSEDLSYAQLMEQELGHVNLENFSQALRQQGFEPDNYWFMPAHPWQW